MKRVYFILLLIRFLDANASKRDSIYQRAIFVDLVSSYYTFFDTRNQIRLNVGTEFNLGKKHFALVSFDAGIFDRYKYSKHFDFFNQSQGYYTITNDVLINGIHIQPSYNYILFQSKLKNFQRVFIGSTFDISFYRKRTHTFNGQSHENIYNKWGQFRLNLGVCTGIEYPVFKRIHIAVQTTMTRKIATLYSNNLIPIKPLNSHWVDVNNKFSWFTNFKICYGF